MEEQTFTRDKANKKVDEMSNLIGVLPVPASPFSNIQTNQKKKEHQLFS